MLWKEIFAEPAAARFGMVGRIAAALIVIGVIVPTLYVFFAIGLRLPGDARRQRYLGYAATMGTILACGGLLLAASRAAGSITSERERDCWTSLLSTPLEPGEIVWAKIAGSVWSLRGVVALLLLIWGLAVLLIPRLPHRHAVSAGNVPAAGILRGGAGREVLAALPQFAAGDGGHAGHRPVHRRTVSVLLHAADVCRRRPRPEEGLVCHASLPAFLFCSPCPSSSIWQARSYSASTRDEGPIMVLAYIFGTIGYTIAAIVLAGSSIGSFDRLAGRTVRTAMPSQAS